MLASTPAINTLFDAAMAASDEASRRFSAAERQRVAMALYWSRSHISPATAEEGRAERHLMRVIWAYVNEAQAAARAAWTAYHAAIAEADQDVA